MLTSPGTSFYPTNDEYSKSSLYVVLIETPFPAKSELNRGDIHQNMKFVRCLIDIIMIIVYQITRVNEFPQKKKRISKLARTTIEGNFRRAQANIGRQRPISRQWTIIRRRKKRKWDGNAQQQYHARGISGRTNDEQILFLYTCKPSSSLQLFHHNFNTIFFSEITFKKSFH